MSDETAEQICEKCGEEVDVCGCCEECGQPYCECCETCGKVNCVCCNECGQQYCECCDSCGENINNCMCCGDCGATSDDCECQNESSGYGSSSRPPWEKRGVIIETLDLTHRWEQDHGWILSFDPVQAAADYYLLESIVGDVPFAASRPTSINDMTVFKSPTEVGDVLLMSTADMKRWTKIRDKAVTASPVANIHSKAKTLFAEHVDHCDKNLIPYFHMAIGGELRHHRAIGQNRVLSSDRGLAWSGWMKVYQHVGDQVYLDAAELFREFAGGSYGGNNWAVPCEILHGRLTGKFGSEQVNKQIFVDRAWTLEHNGGCFLNKINWTNSLQGMKPVLDAQAQDPTNYPSLIKAASPAVRTMFRNYWKESVKELEKLGFPVQMGSEEMTLESPPRFICRHCSSNANLGHTVECKWLWELAESAITKVEEAEFSLHSWSTWGQAYYPFDKDGFINNNYHNPYSQSVTRFTIRYVLCDGDGMEMGTYKIESSLGEFMSGELQYSIEDLVKMVAANGEETMGLDAQQLLTRVHTIKARFRLNGDKACITGDYVPLFQAGMLDHYHKYDLSDFGLGLLIHNKVSHSSDIFVKKG